MSSGPFSPHSSSPHELKQQIEAERAQTPFLVYRDENDEQQILTLHPSAGRLRVGRDPMCDLCLAEDDRVSRLHAELENVGDVWTLADSRGDRWRAAAAVRRPAPDPGRARLAETALRTGLVTRRELGEP